ncbi:cupin domain-containing protein [Actinobacillus porcinus]|uniref:ribosomal protein uL16 3-hydroxylase n=1 Tax=Actinobacillus porcinus TaxID=51048 RepID=UPI0023F40779|nr:cupin domain-containing protein [Actinobacillus porcinus]MDD7546141.1 cupin domain-containing protein [Actinobacillus porcinus]MDY5847224.1 cupin domain-containing protein [Actinobacillus porcinus]
MNYCLPNEITPEIFLRDYWQKKPLVVRNALPQIVGMFEPADIFELATNEEATARLVKQYTDDDWRVKLGGITEADLADVPEKWSVLVQNMEQWSEELGEMWNAFGFIPQWQRDDIMVSYAPQGGSVGKHYDEYDVFLVQGYGHRRWQVGKWCDPSTEFKPNQPIRIFDDMGELVIDEVMAPGDLLYIPSRMAHYGVAQDDCLTFSFGLRYPNLADLLENINRGFCHQDDRLNLTEFLVPLRLSQSEQKTGLLGQAEIQAMKTQFLQTLSQSAEFDRLFQQAVATTVTSRRYEMLVSDELSDPDEVQEWLEDGAVLVQDNNCKLAYLAEPLEIYANGEWLDELNALEKTVLKHLADGEALDWATLQTLVAEQQSDDDLMLLLIDSICNWLDDGWVLCQ